MGKKEKEIEKQPVEPVEKVDKSVISSDEVEEVIQGDEEALLEQMERFKNLTKEQQLAAIEAEKRKAAEKLLMEAKAKQEAELKAQEEAKKQAELKAQEEAKKQAELKAQEDAKLQAVLKAEEEKRKAAEKILLDAKAKQEAELKAQEEAKKREESQKKPINEDKGGPNTIKTIGAILLFALFFAMVYFMPEITKFINDYKEKNAPKEIITTGTSTCSLKKSTKKLDIEITAAFSIVNKKLYKLIYTTATKGDKNDDKKELEEKYNECLNLKTGAGNLDGVSIVCSLNNGISSNKQILDYEKLDAKQVTSAYTEAGGIYPEFKKGEDIDKIEAKMIAANYKCVRN